MTNEKLTYKINNLHINQTQPKKKKTYTTAHKTAVYTRKNPCQS